MQDQTQPFGATYDKGDREEGSSQLAMDSGRAGGLSHDPLFNEASRTDDAGKW